MTAPTQLSTIVEPARQHTPTPWKLQANSFGTLFIYGDLDNPKMSPMGVSYCHLVAGGDHPGTLSAENAIFLVEAVNSHASLKARIEELEGALREIRGMCGSCHAADEFAVSVDAVARAALEAKS